MTVILGIDAAWTAQNPSGVALIVSDSSKWHCAAVAPSYDAFFELAQGIPVDWTSPRFLGSVPNVPRLLEAANRLVNAPVDIVTIDMPVSTIPIVGRRVADNAISTKFGRFGCAAHSPSESRPGPMGAVISRQFVENGYSIATTFDAPGTTGRLVEVYPHPALLMLLRRAYRVPYKVTKARKYWPELTPSARASKLIKEFVAIYSALTASIDSCWLPIPRPETEVTIAGLKQFEDALDALVCAWVGIRYIEGSAVPNGDETGAIWCPL